MDENNRSLSGIPEEEFIPLPELSLEELKRNIIRNIDDYAKLLHKKIVDKYSTEEMAGWTQKRVDCEKFRDDKVISGALRIELKARYPDLTEIEAATIFSPIVILKAEYFHAASSKITGARGRHSDAISRMASREEVSSYDWWSEGWI